MKTNELHFKNWKPEDFKFNKTPLTPDTITKTRHHFAENSQACIDEVLSGEVRVNDPKEYIKDRQEWKRKYLEGDFKISLAFLQAAYWIQTGKSIALLP